MAVTRGDLLVCFLLFLSASVAAADSIFGCGGFIQASSSLIKARKASDSKLDYSHITVELRTVDGLVKDWTQCAPNGYYFIPVYDKGSFVIKVKGPDGWSWHPDSVPVVIDQDGCNANADINFKFTGFAITGRLKGAVGGKSCSLEDGGPSGVKVELLSLLDDLIASAFTSATGEYSFTNVTPGRYKLCASHPNLEIEVRGSSELELSFGNLVVDDVFFVSGYEIRGFVVAQGNPILGVHVYLYSDDVLEVHCPNGIANSPWPKKALCHAVSDADGKFTFASVPCGAYELVPYYKGENTVFDVSPASLAVNVDHLHVTIAQKFQVTGFSVGGRVVDGSGAGVGSAEIIVDGQLRAVTDSEGFYKLDQVTSKNYSISARKDHYKFNSLENFLVLPNMASIDNIEAVSYDLCGIVRSIITNSKAKVMLTHGPENVQPQMRLTNDGGSFCFEVPPGEYRLSALGVESDTSSGLLYSPSYVDVKVDRPISYVEFYQAQVDVRGSVLCKEKCSPLLSVFLTRLVGKGGDERKTVSLSPESGSFIFSKVFPGKYRIEVKHDSSSVMLDDSWCWEQNSVDLDVGAEDIEGIVFIQKGYWVDIISSHDTNAYILLPDSSHMDLLIRRGPQRICVESPGLHELQFANSCILFESSSIKFDTPNPLPLYVTAKKYLVKGEIHIDSDLETDVSDLSGRIIVDILNKEATVLDTVQTRLVTGENNQAGSAIYKYSIWSDLGVDLIFVPQDISSMKEKKLLFYPRQHHVSVMTDGCQPSIPQIVGRAGLYVEGSVTPATSGVNIKIFAAEESNNAPLKKGDLVLESMTEDDGSFVAGPLYDDASYDIKAFKPGYHIKQVGPNSFTCQKLGQILVHIKDVAVAGELFPPVLLSLSGEDGYRNNSISGAGGTFCFDSLFPGSFYLRPLLKEYSFSPATVAIELGSGESKVIEFRATRVAYSAMGTVSLLSGQPKGGVIIEARSESKGFYEEATTDYMGSFRLRGLIPDTSYLVKVLKKVDGGVAIERASPESMLIKVGSEDIRGVNFVVFEQPESTILTGHVEGGDIEALRPYLSIEVKLASDPSKIQSVLPLPLSYYFEIRDLPKGKHLIELRASLPSNSHIFESEILEVDLEKQPQVHVGPLRYKVEEYHHKLELTPAPVFPLIVGVSVIALFISMPRLKDLYQMALGLAPLGSTPMVTKKETRKQVLKKRAN